jgi:hypothetical protein
MADDGERRQRAERAFPSLADENAWRHESAGLGTDFEDIGAGVEFDSTELAQRFSDEFNATPARYTLDDDGNVSYVGPVDVLGGIPAVLAVDMSDDNDPFRQLLASTVDEHRAHPSPGDPRGGCLVIVDPCTDDHELPSLPPWSPHGPNNQNVVLVVIAGRTHELRPLRGAFTGWTVARQIANGEIETFCSLRQSSRCTPEQPREILTMAFGNIVCFFRSCAPCYFDIIEGRSSAGGGYSYDNLDPLENSGPEFGDDFLGGMAGTFQP